MYVLNASCKANQLGQINKNKIRFINIKYILYLYCNVSYYFTIYIRYSIIDY